jgi:hypothetical protein
VRWIGAAGSDTPAPQVTVTAGAKAAAKGVRSQSVGGAIVNSTSTPPSKPAVQVGSGSGIAGLAIGAFGVLVLGGAFTALRRRRSSPASAQA